jgi:hypothetical protein
MCESKGKQVVCESGDFTNTPVMCRAINAYHPRPIAYVKFPAASFEKLFGHERSPPSGASGDGRRRTSQS